MLVYPVLVWPMIVGTAALVLLVVLAAGVTVADAVRSSHWRVVAVERRRSWLDRVGGEPAGDEPAGPVENGAR